MTAAEADGGARYRRRKRWRPTAAAETAADGDNGRSRRRRRRRRTESPGSTKLMPGWIRFREPGQAEPSRAEPSRGKRTKVEPLEWRLKALLPCFPLSHIFCSCFSRIPVFFVPRLNPFFHYTISPSTISPLLVFDCLTVFHQRKKIKYRLCLAQPCHGLFTQNPAPSADLGASRKYSNENFED